MKRISWMLLLIAGLSVAAPLAAQKHETHDALTDKEADQMRELALEPNKRLHMMATFAKARMEAIDHLRSDQNMAATQQDKIQELLDDVASIVDEIDENLADYDTKGEDVRKALREVIEMDSDFQLKLRAIKETSTSEPSPKKVFGFAVDNAIESVNSSADAARAMLDDQNVKKGKEKIEKPEKEDTKSAKKDKPPKEKKQKPDYTGMGGIGQQKPQ